MVVQSPEHALHRLNELDDGLILLPGVRAGLSLHVVVWGTHISFEGLGHDWVFVPGQAYIGNPAEQGYGRQFWIV